ELRTIPDINDYLDKRGALPERTRRTVGGETSLYQYYVLNEGSFTGCSGYEDARIVAATREEDFEEYLRLRPQRDKYASVVEPVSDCLAERLETYAEGVHLTDLAGFDNPANRKQYLLIQEELCDLGRFERDSLGMQFQRLMDKVKDSQKNETMAYGMYYADSKPDFLYVLLSSKGIDRPTIIERSNILLRA